MWTTKLTVETIKHIIQDKELKVNDQWIGSKPTENQRPNSIKKKPEKSQEVQENQEIKIQKIAIKGEPLVPK